jgi:mRNA interferase RelE/StbE
MRYSVEVPRSVEKELIGLPKNVRRRVVDKLLELESNPRPQGAKALESPLEGLRIRVGDWRVLYTVDDETHTVVVYSVMNRREVYRRNR